MGDTCGGSCGPKIPHQMHQMSRETLALVRAGYSYAPNAPKVTGSTGLQGRHMRWFVRVNVIAPNVPNTQGSAQPLPRLIPGQLRDPTKEKKKCAQNPGSSVRFQC
jgi:hypothetical protein